MKIKRFEFNMFPVNCYVLWDDTLEATVIDPGCYYEEEKQALLRCFPEQRPHGGKFCRADVPVVSSGQQYENQSRHLDLPGYYCQAC